MKIFWDTDWNRKMIGNELIHVNKIEHIKGKEFRIGVDCRSCKTCFDVKIDIDKVNIVTCVECGEKYVLLVNQWMEDSAKIVDYEIIGYNTYRSMRKKLRLSEYKNERDIVDLLIEEKYSEERRKYCEGA